MKIIYSNHFFILTRISRDCVKMDIVKKYHLLKMQITTLIISKVVKIEYCLINRQPKNKGETLYMPTHL